MDVLRRAAFHFKEVAHLQKKNAEMGKEGVEDEAATKRAGFCSSDGDGV